jgi:hypothetical protein
VQNVALTFLLRISFCLLVDMHFIHGVRLCISVNPITARTCKAMATPEWYKSFGIREFDSAMIEFEVKRGCEEVQLQIIKDRREVVLSICPDVEQTEEFNRFLKDVLGKEFLSKLFPVMQECTLWCLLCSVFLVWSDSECELKCFAEEFVPSNS